MKLIYETVDKKKEFFDFLNFIGTIRQGNTISAGMSTIEASIIDKITKSKMFGNIVQPPNGKKKHYIKTGNVSRKTGTYEVDAIYDNGKILTLVDVKPPSHDNSVPADAHAKKFMDAIEAIKKENPKRKVDFVLMIYGRTEKDFSRENYFKTMKNCGIKCLSALDEFAFDHHIAQRDNLFINLETLCNRAISRGHGNEKLKKMLLKLQNI